MKWSGRLRVRPIVGADAAGTPDPDRATRGTAAIELALLSPVLLILLTGLIEIGMAVYESMQVNAAAEAGALYAANRGSSDIAKIKLAVTSATSAAGITAFPDPLVRCGCPIGTGVTYQGDCTTLCADTKLPGTYVTVSATIQRTKLLALPFISLPLPDSFVAQSSVRTK